MDKDVSAFRTISEAAEAIDVPQHVLRFWETRFSQIAPLKRAGGRRFYRPKDLELLSRIRHLLYNEGYTIRGVQKLLKDDAPRPVADQESAIVDVDERSDHVDAAELSDHPTIPNEHALIDRARAALALIVEARTILERARQDSTSRHDAISGL